MSGGRKQNLDEQDPFTEIIAQFGLGYTVKIYRREPKTQNKVFITSFGAEDLELSAVQEEYGGGVFQFQFYEGRDYRKSVTQHIAGPVLELSKIMDKETPVQTDERYREEAEELRAQLRDLSLEQRLDAGLLEMRSLIAGIRQAPADQADPFTMALGLLKTMQAQTLPHVTTPAPGMNMEQMLSVMKMGIELGRGGGEGASGFEGVLERFAPQILGALEGISGGAQPPALNPPPEDVQPMNLQSALAQWVPFIVQWAEGGKSEAVCAQFIEDQLPQHWLGELDTFLEKHGGQAVTIMTEWYPELLIHSAWVKELLLQLTPQDIEVADEVEAAAEAEPDPDPLAEETAELEVEVGTVEGDETGEA
ncbi:hypothetical protein LCGC14_1792670 [marine sediment metagenome]|uniref:Uncharacterized protein n=1 Tax=marine sediment metagenome TaxID=412755 RepID=A0A0F9GS18_9ZZZZ